MTLVFMLKSFDGQPDGATYFELYLEGEGHVATSDGVYPTPDVAAEVIRRLVFACQHHKDYGCDVGVDPETWKWAGLFPNPDGTQHYARTMYCDTEEEARQLIDTVFLAIARIEDPGIPIAGPVYDGPTDIVDGPQTSG